MDLGFIKDIGEIVETLITSKFAVAIVTLGWVFYEAKNHREDKKQHITERKEWAERIDEVTETMRMTVEFLKETRRNMNVPQPPPRYDDYQMSNQQRPSSYSQGRRQNTSDYNEAEEERIYDSSNNNNGHCDSRDRHE